MKALIPYFWKHDNAYAQEAQNSEIQANPFSHAKNQLSRISSQGALVPYEQEAQEALRVAEDLEWQNSELKEQALESAKGLILSVINYIPKQAELHLKQLVYAGNLNKAEVAVSVLNSAHKHAKPFAVCEHADNELEVKGHGYTWNLSAIDISSEAIPAQHLERLTVLRAKGYEPDSLYIAVPMAKQRLSLPKAVSDETRKLITSMSAAITKTNQAVKKGIEKIKLADPVLIAGFGQNPVVLVEIGRWI